MSKLCGAIILMTTLISAAMAGGEPELPNVAWLHTLGFGLAHLHGYDDFDRANSIAFDPSGYVYIAGESNSFLYNDTNPVLVKLNANGQPHWAAVWDGPGVGMRVAIDSKGNAFLAGRLGSFFFDSQQRPFLTKVAPDGRLVWNSVWEPSFTSSAGYWVSVQGLAIDSYGGAFVSGSVGKSYPPQYAFVVKFDPIGTISWSKVWSFANMSDGCPGSYGCFEVTSIALDAVGNVNVAGSAGNDTLVARFSSNGDLQWSRVLREYNRQVSTVAMVLDATGNIYAAANSEVWSPGGACTGAWEGYSSEVVLSKFAQNGSAYWVKTLETPAEPDYFLSGAVGVAIDSDGDMYVVGQRYAPYLSNGSDGLGRSEVFVAKFASDGKLYSDVGTLAQTDCTICVCRHFLQAAGIAADPAGNIYIGGSGVNPLLENLTTAKLSAVLSDENVTIRDLPPIIHDDLGFVVEHPASEAFGASITIDEPPLNPYTYTRMIVMKLQEHAVVTSTTTVATETTQTSSMMTAPTDWIEFPAYPIILIAILIGLSIVAGRKRSGGNQN
jgi:hypothetical protein